MLMLEILFIQNVSKTGSDYFAIENHSDTPQLKGIVLLKICTDIYTIYKCVVCIYTLDITSEGLALLLGPW